MIAVSFRFNEWAASSVGTAHQRAFRGSAFDLMRVSVRARTYKSICFQFFIALVRSLTLFEVFLLLSVGVMEKSALSAGSEPVSPTVTDDSTLNGSGYDVEAGVVKESPCKFANEGWPTDHTLNKPTQRRRATGCFGDSGVV